MTLQVVVILIAAAAALLFLWLGAKRRKELGMWAARHGLSFRQGKDAGFDDRYPAFSCLRRGHSRYAHNVMSGAWEGRTVTAFDYRYVIGHGKNRSVHHFSAVIVDAGIPVQSLSIRPEGVFDRVTEFFGAEDIDFESVEFSRQFHVKSPDPRWAFDVLHQRTMEFLLSRPRFRIQFSGREAIVWRGRRFRPEQFEQALGVIHGILDRLPGYILDSKEGR